MQVFIKGYLIVTYGLLIKVNLIATNGIYLGLLNAVNLPLLIDGCKFSLTAYRIPRTSEIFHS